MQRQANYTGTGNGEKYLPAVEDYMYSFTSAPVSMNTDTERDGPLISRLLAVHRR